MAHVLGIVIILVVLLCGKTSADNILQGCEFFGKELQCKGSNVTTFPTNIPKNTTTIRIIGANFAGLAFENITLGSVKNLYIYNSRIEKVGIFKSNSYLLNVNFDNNKIKNITPGAFDNLEKLTSLTLSSNELKTFPIFNRVKWKLAYLNLDDNIIGELKPGQLKKLLHLKWLYLRKNSFKTIPNGFFDPATHIQELLFTDTPIRTIGENAFENLRSLIKLSLDGTQIDHLPSKGLQNLETLNMKRVNGLSSIPLDLNKIQSIDLADDKSFLCCKFFAERKTDHCGPQTVASRAARPTSIYSTTPNTSTPTIRSTSTIPSGFGKRKRSVDEIVTLATPAYNGSMTFVPCVERLVNCTPRPNVFQPCENIMGKVWLTAVSFFIAPFALCGNFVVIVVFLCLARHYSVSRFLVTNLAIADMCMGVYLLSLVVESVITSGEYYNHVTRFQYGLSCQVLGFLAIFSSELSVFSLTLITVERYLTIVYALYPKRRLGMKKAIILMAIGWIVSITIALLPIFGISSYGKVAICLPFEVENGGKWYLLFVFCFNGISFIFITVLYTQMYRSVFVPENSTPNRKHDSKVARRMAILIFTDFACFAPIAITGLSAMFGYKLIDVTKSKYLLVFFFPINSFMNPFLYALITKKFRRDLASLLKNCFVCGGTLTEYLTTLPARSLHSNNDHISRTTRQSIDFNTMDEVNSVHGSRENNISASFSKSEPGLVRFNNLALEPSNESPRET